MPISFNTALTAINNFKDGDRVVYDQQSGTLKAAGFWHRVKSFFGVRSAKDQNQDTLEALKSAILHDPRLTGGALDDIADALFAEIRTDRAIDASVLKGIFDGFSQLATNTQPMLKTRVLMHMAFRPFPPELGRAQEEVVDFIADHLSRDPAVQRDPASAKIPEKATQTLGLIRDLGRQLHGSRGTPDPRLLPVYVKNLVPLLWSVDAQGNRTLRGGSERWNRMGTLSRYLAAAETRAQQLGEPNFVNLAMKFLDGLLSMPDPGPFDHLEDLIRDVPLEDLVRLDAGLTASDIDGRYLASLQPPAPPPPPPAPAPAADPDPVAVPVPDPAPAVAASSGAAAGPSIPAIHNEQEFIAFIKSLDETSAFGTVLPDVRMRDADGVSRQTFDFRGIVFRGEDRDTGIRFNGFDSQTDLSDVANRREAMGLGTGAPGNIINRGVTGNSGVSTAKNPAAAMVYRKAGDILYVIDTRKIPRGAQPWNGRAWDMDETFLQNNFGTRDRSGAVATGGEVNCSVIPAAAIIGAIVISREADEPAAAADKIRNLKDCPVTFNPAYRP